MKKRAMKLRLSRETLRNLAERDLEGAAGAITTNCTNPTGLTDCHPCYSEVDCPSAHCSDVRC